MGGPGEVSDDHLHIRARSIELSRQGRDQRWKTTPALTDRRAPFAHGLKDMSRARTNCVDAARDHRKRRKT